MFATGEMTVLAVIVSIIVTRYAGHMAQGSIWASSSALAFIANLVL
jgi:hypothetical protein